MNFERRPYRIKPSVQEVSADLVLSTVHRRLGVAEKMCGPRYFPVEVTTCQEHAGWKTGRFHGMDAGKLQPKGKLVWVRGNRKERLECEACRSKDSKTHKEVMQLYYGVVECPN